MASDEEIIEIKKKLEEHEKRIRKLEVEKGKSTKEISVDIERGIEKMSKNARIPEERIRCVFDFDEEDLSLIATVEGKNESEKQFKATVCILAAYHYCYGRDEIKSQDIRKKLEWFGIKSLVNLSTNLSEYKQFILPKGKPKSKEFSYKITLPGIKKGLEIIKELSGA